MPLKSPRSLYPDTRQSYALVHGVMLPEPMNLRQLGHFCALTTCCCASGPLCGTPREATQGTELCRSLAEQGEVGAQPTLGAAPLPGEQSGHRAHRQPVPGTAGLHRCPLSGLHPQSLVTPRGDDMTGPLRTRFSSANHLSFSMLEEREPVECGREAAPRGVDALRMSHGNLATSVTTQTPRPQASLPGSRGSPDRVFRPQGFLY